MRRKLCLVALVLCLLFPTLSPAVHAQEGPSVLGSSVVAEFPLRLNFSLSAQSAVNITDIRLDYSVDRVGFARVISEAVVEFMPGTSVNASWALEMVQTGGFPTGTKFTYFWRVRDASGATVETEPAEVRFDDTRYRWQSITEGMVTIYWYLGDEAFAQEMMSAARQALERLEADTGASLAKPVELYVYAGYEDLRGALIYPPEWVGGVNYPAFHVIMLAIGPGGLTQGKLDIAHELTHQVTHQMTANPYNNIPTWLDEGLSKYAEGILSPFLVFYLYQAIESDSLISVRSLASEFSAIPETAYLAYAQSYSIVEFLITSYGRAKTLELLQTFSQGSTYDGALKKVYGFDMDGLNDLWRGYVSGQYQLPDSEAEAPQTLVTAGQREAR